MTAEFVGKGIPLSGEVMNAASGRLQVGLAEIWAVLKVETKGCGFLPDRRPQILFERHVFHRETQGRFDAAAPDISNPHAGGYGADGAHQYDRLARAITLDRRAALRSASWGIGQVMGFNAEELGFAGVEQMVQDMTESEGAQLRGVLEFLLKNGLHRAMQRHDWKAVARGYNGPDFAVNDYDGKLGQEFARLSANGLPDLRVRAAQLLLTYRGGDPGPIDGQIGNRTRAALTLFQQQSGLPVTGEPDDPTMAALGA